MNINRLSVLSVCIAISLAVIAGPVDAEEKGKKKHQKQNKGYPNGRGWRAVERDFKIVKRKLNKVNRKLNRVVGKLNVIDDKVDYIADDVLMLKNVLEVQVHVAKIKPDVTIDQNYNQVVYVQVIHNGMGVPNLTEQNFVYKHSFPYDAASFCGAPCFSEGQAGQYAIMLKGKWEPGVFAGTLRVHTKYDDLMSYGTSQVVVDISDALYKPI
jgi:hypothetical protein